jgi:hypothetical protein
VLPQTVPLRPRHNPIGSTKLQKVQSAKKDDPSRVPSVYLGWAFLQFLFHLPFRRINNLRVFNALGSSIPTTRPAFLILSQELANSQSGNKRVRGIGLPPQQPRSRIISDFLMTTATASPLSDVSRKVLRVQVITLIWMSGEAIVSLGTGWTSHSPALLAFGGDSLIELLSAAVVFWRLPRSVSGEIQRRTAGLLVSQFSDPLI